MTTQQFITAKAILKRMEEIDGEIKTVVGLMELDNNPFGFSDTFREVLESHRRHLREVESILLIKKRALEAEFAAI